MVSTHCIYGYADHADSGRGTERAVAGTVRASGSGVHDFPSLIIATVRARLVRLFHFMTVGALGERRSGQMIMCSPLILPSM
jgi:hypothetical protein